MKKWKKYEDKPLPFMITALDFFYERDTTLYETFGFKSHLKGEAIIASDLLKDTKVITGT